MPIPEHPTDAELAQELRTLRQQLRLLGPAQAECTRLAQALRLSQVRYLQVLENSSDPIFSFSPEGEYLFVNQAFADGVGQTRAALVGKRIWDIFLRGEADLRFAAVKWVLEHGQSKSIEVRVTRPDGIHHYITTLEPLRDEQQQVVSVLCTAREITQRLAAQRSLREAQERYRQLVETSPIGIVVYQHGLMVYANPAAVDMFGADSPDALLGLPLIDRIHPDFRGIVEQRMAAILGQGTSAPRRELKLLRLDGRVIDVDAQGALIEYHGLPAVQSVYIDITQRNAALEELRQNEMRWEFALEGAGDGVWDWLIQDDIAHFSRRWKAMLGYSAEEIGNAADEWVKRLHPDDTPAVMAELQAHVEGKTPAIHVEYRIRHKDGRFIWVLARGMVFQRDAAGLPTRVVGTNTDITERKLAEQREQQHKRVLQMLSGKAPLAELLQTLTSDFERLLPGLRCGIWLLDELGLHLKRGAAPSLPEEFVRACEGLTVGLDSGCCGQAAITGEAVIAADVMTHPNWADLRALAQRAEIRACWSYPILSEYGAVLGTLAVYQRQPDAPSLQQLQWIEDQARLAALAIDKTKAQARLQLAASVFMHAREGIMITDAAGSLLEVNDTFSQITGFARSEALGRNPRMLKSGRQSAEYYAAMWQALIEQGHWYGEVWNRRKNGELYAALTNISAVRDDAGQTQNYVALFSDITPRKEHEHRLEAIAHYDLLTGLPNRLLLADRLRQAMAQALRRNCTLALVYLDLDGFKAVNDQFGHPVGDELLITLAQRLKEALREGDTLARIGGDEFIALLIDLEQVRDCQPVLERLLQAAALPVPVADALLRVSASLGVALYPQDGSDTETLMRHADLAMYQAKLAGKNRYHLFDPAHTAAAASTQRETLERIELAFERRELLLYYQPRVDLHRRRVVGCEALLRWQHPERGLLSAADFLPVVQDHPLMLEIGQWVMTSALGQANAWRADGTMLPVSVNIATRELLTPGFAERLAAQLARHPDWPPGALALELQEVSTPAHLAPLAQTLDACRPLGVAVVLDGFGAGLSSLVYLRRLSGAALKIDQSLVHDMLTDTEALALVQGVIGLAQGFTREVVGAGVETPAQGARLQALGCVLVQGHGIAEPMPAAALPDWVARWPTLAA